MSGRACGFCGDVGCGRCAESDALSDEEYAATFPQWVEQ